jgi:Arc/MetJ-type ribon-helix-helix transcriptional regulator
MVHKDMTEKVSIEIRRDLYDKAKKFIEEQGGFSSVEELVEFLLEEVLSSEEAEERGLSKEDEEKVKERLRALGYI